MFQSNNIWDPMWPKDPKGVIDDKHILDSIIDKNEALLKSSGTPMTLWKFYPFGPECYCNKDGNIDSKCGVCFGSGYLNGYQKYGNNTYTYSSTSLDRDDRFGLSLSNIHLIDIPGQDSKALVITEGTTGYVETNWIPIKDAKKHSYLKSRVFTPEGTSVSYSVTFNGVDYTAIYNLKTDLDQLPIGETQIKIRLTLARNTINTPSPAINAFRYRIKVRDDYHQYDKRFDTLEPAFLASKQIIGRNLAISQEGHTVKYEPQFWALPDVKITERDIGVFLKGNHENQRFEFQNLTISEHGENQRVLHTKWTSRFIYSSEEVLGHVYNLD